MWIAHATAAEFGMTPYSNFDELLADMAMDIVAINTPPPSLAALSIAALDSGKYVFCENCWRLLSSMPKLCSTWLGNKCSLTFLAKFIATIHLVQVQIRHVY